jgi:hypothetical protein
VNALALQFDRIRRVACRDRGASESVRWHRRLPNADLVQVPAGGPVASAARPEPCMPVLLGARNVPAFFGLPTRAPMRREANAPCAVRDPTFGGSRETALPAMANG